LPKRELKAGQVTQIDPDFSHQGRKGREEKSFAADYTVGGANGLAVPLTFLRISPEILRCALNDIGGVTDTGYNKTRQRVASAVAPYLSE
jgi:hypothetical protein